MNRIINTIFALILICGILSAANIVNVTDKKTDLILSQDLPHAVRFQMALGDMLVLPQTHNNNQYSRLSLPGFHTSKGIGAPELPELHQLIEIPHDATPRVEVHSFIENVYTLADLDMQQIYPVQDPLSKSQDPASVVFRIDQNLYSQDNFQNDELITVLDKGFLRQVRIGNVLVKPIDYNPVSGELKMVTSIDFTIHFDNANLGRTELRQSQYYSPYFEPIYTQLANYDPSSFRNDDLMDEKITYVIVANQVFRGYLGDFIQWKTEKGYKVVVGYTDEIGSSSSNIRSFIMDLYNNPTDDTPAPSFVLLIGDTSQLPASYSSGGHVSDLDYCDFTGDKMPEILHGRFSAQTPTHLTSQIDKTLEYEQFTFPDPGFLSRTVMISGVDASMAPTYGNGQINYGNDYYYNTSHGYTTNHTYLYPESGQGGVDAEIRNKVSQGAGFVNYTAHGWESGWADPSFENSDVENLSNAHEYPLIVGNCCLTNAFDTGECFGESLLRAQNKGAVGYIGGSDVTYWNEDYWWGVGSGGISANPTYNGTGHGAYDGAFHENGEDTWAVVNSAFMFVGNLAVVEANGMDDYYWEIYHLMGDPSVSTYFGTPEENDIFHLPVIPMGSSSVTVSALPFSFVGISQDGNLIGSGMIGDNGSENISIDAISSPEEISIVITRQNTIPYIGTANVGNIDGAYLIMNSVSADVGNDNIITPGEDIDVSVSVENIGTESAENVYVSLTDLNNNPYITIIDGSSIIQSLGSNASSTVQLSFIVNNAAPFGHGFSLHIEAELDDDIYTYDLELSINALSESFENSGFADQPWELAGNANWRIDAEQYYDGSYSARSGTIGNNTISSLTITMDIVESGTISFYKRVSCEDVGSSSGDFYDYLAFYIDDVEQGKWAGEVSWSQNSYNVEAGERTFRWTYIKDEDSSDDVDSGEDAVWVDTITFPPCFDLSNFVAGDVNYDESINVLDVVLIVGMILGTTPPDSNADMNSDGSVNVLDVVILVNVILGE